MAQARRVIGSIEIVYPEGTHRTVMTDIADIGEWLAEAGRIYEEEQGRYEVRVQRRLAGHDRCLRTWLPRRASAG